MATNLPDLPYGFKQLNNGVTVNDQSGDTLMEAVNKLNSNFNIVVAQLQAIETRLTALESGKAPLAAPVFTGNPTRSVHLSAASNDKSLATTKFVNDAISTAIANL